MANPLLSLAAAAARWLPAPLKRALYRLGPVSSGLRSALNRAAPAGLTEVEVAGGLLAGSKMLLDLQTEKDYWLGNYEFELQEAIREFAKPGMVAYDIGANIGYTSLLLAKHVGTNGKVFAFEPLTSNQERLQKNLDINASSNVKVILKAVADVSGKRQFVVHSSGAMGKLRGSNGRETQYQNSIEIESVALDEFVFKQRNSKPDLIKIDIEGAEGLALQGMMRVIQEAKPLLMIELHGEEAARACWQILTNTGYSIHKLTRGYPQVFDLSNLSWKSYILARQPA